MHTHVCWSHMEDTMSVRTCPGLPFMHAPFGSSLLSKHCIAPSPLSEHCLAPSPLSEHCIAETTAAALVCPSSATEVEHSLTLPLLCSLQHPYPHRTLPYPHPHSPLSNPHQHPHPHQAIHTHIHTHPPLAIHTPTHLEYPLILDA